MLSTSEWGHNFRPDYLKLAGIARELQVEPVLALTATATPPVLADICRVFDIDSADAVRTGFHRPNLQLSSPRKSLPVPIDLSPALQGPYHHVPIFVRGRET